MTTVKGFNMASQLDNPPVPTEVSEWLFFRHLRSSRLLPAGDVDAIERMAGDESLAAVLDRLVTDGTLTSYQVARISAGMPDGLIFGQYRVLDEIGSGGCGQVFRARHALTDRIVALKVITPELSKDLTIRELFLREVVATTRLSHPNIAAAYHADEFGGQVFLAMEFVDGRTLHDVVVADGPLSAAVAYDVLLQCGRALEHAHENGLVHRDIKPANILLAPGGPAGPPAGRVKLIDFGLARHHTVGRNLLNTIPCTAGSVIGTPAYIAPEQITDVHEADIRADLYSLGCSLYFALSGRVPFNGKTMESVLYQHLSQLADPLTGLPAALSQIVARLMAKDPNDRYQTPAELIAAVERVRDGGAFDTPGAAGPGLRPEPYNDAADAPTQVVAKAELPTEPGPIKTQRTVPPAPADPAALRALWADWRSVVDGFAAGAAVDITDAEYKALYRELVAAIRAAAHDPSGTAPVGAESLMEVVEPWVSRAALEGLEPHMLHQVARTCRTLDGLLWPPEPAGRGGAAAALLLLVACAAAAAAAKVLGAF